MVDDDQGPLPRSVSERTSARVRSEHRARNHVRVENRDGRTHVRFDQRVITRNTAVGGGLALAVVIALVAVWYFRGAAADRAEQTVRDVAADVCVKITQDTGLPPVQAGGTFATSAVTAIAEQKAVLVDDQAARLRAVDAPASLRPQLGQATQALADLGAQGHEAAATVLPELLGPQATLEELTALASTAPQQRYRQAEVAAHDVLADISGRPCPPQ